jgi:hypothetical protein
MKARCPVEDQLGLRPTPEQYQSFGDYLWRAHSWYKHLPLLGGRTFVVFVAADAGIGRLLARINGTNLTLVPPPEGPEFTDEHPRLHYGWQTTREYRSRFGYLDYMQCPGPDEPYDRDAGPPVRLPRSLEERCRFVLYPYVHPNFAAAVTWACHEEALARLRSGEAHPAREEVLELARLAAAEREAWSSLSDQEREWALGQESGAERALPAAAGEKLRRYADLEGAVGAVAASLHAPEATKIRRALAALDEWLLHGE